MEDFLSEVMLNKITFVEYKNDIKFEFYDSDNGKDLKDIICRNIFSLKFDSTFILNDESYPCLVYEVISSKLEDENDIMLAFENLNYGYKYSNNLAIPKSDSFYLFRIKGGPIDISIICEIIEINKK